MKLSQLFITLLLLWSLPAAAADSAAETQLFTRNRNGVTEVLLQLDIKPEWHVFAPYEQEFGSPLQADWILPVGTKVSEESFSRPQRFDYDGFAFDGYEKQAFYKATVINPDGAELKLKLRWQACNEECVSNERILTVGPADSLNFNAKTKEAEPYFARSDMPHYRQIMLILLAALAGGIILNLMPCVLPVLGLKIISLVGMQKENRRREAMFYTLGVIVSMLALVSLLLMLRALGAPVGWGFQLQSPWFVGIMLILFIVLSLLMLDVIRFNGGFMSRINIGRLQNESLNAFMTGLLAVLIASPCTAPFMGAAVGYALMVPAYLGLPIFFCLGLGYALPFTFLAMYPRVMQKLLPKSGKWMNVLKKFLSIPLILTCLWLGWILGAQTGLLTSGKSLQWQDYTPAKVETALAVKRPVFIDFTASWCLTCMMNKKTSLQSDTMAKLVKEKNILLLRADATGRSVETEQALNAYGRASVPLYIYYDGKSKDYQILPQILTPDILSRHLK